MIVATMEDNEYIDDTNDYAFQDADIMPANSVYFPSETDEDDEGGLPYLLRGAELISSSDSDEEDDYISEVSDSEEERDVPGNDRTTDLITSTVRQE